MTPGWLVLLAPAMALAATAVLTPVTRGAAIQLGLVKRPRDDRWHREPTPLLGGVAVFLGFAGAALIFYSALPDALVLDMIQTSGRGLLERWDGLIWGGVAVFVVGLIDDVRPLTPAWKLAGQVAAASLFVAADIMLHFTNLYALDAVISIVWFLAITNGLNLLDNMDGLAGGTGAIAALCLAALFALDGNLVLAGLALALAGALAGFLIYNYPPARIFLGDSGSLFVGLFLGGLALSPSPGLSRGLFAVMAAPLLILAIPIFDMALVTVTRWAEGRSIAQGGRDHSSHRLVALGLPEDRAVKILWALAALGGMTGLLLRTRDRAVAYLFGGLLLLLLALFGIVLVRLSAARAARSGAPVSAPNPLAKRLSEWHERWPVLYFGLDLGAVALSYYAAYLVRWDAAALPAELEYFRRSLAVVLATKMLVFAAVGLQSQRWSHFGLEDASRVVRANLLGSLLLAGVLLVIERVGLSRGVLVIDFLVCSALTTGVRFSQRIVDRGVQAWRQEGTPAVVYAAPDDAAIALAELLRGEERVLRPVAVVHPEAEGAKRGTFKGYPCYRGRERLGRALQDTGARAVVTLERTGSGEIKGLGEDCQRAGADLYVLKVALEKAR